MWNWKAEFYKGIERKNTCQACNVEVEDYLDLHCTYPESDCHHCLALNKDSIQVCQDCWEGPRK